jgi:putative redox protein
MTVVSKASIASTGTNYLHRIRAGHFDLVTDEPPSLGGQGQGPAPFDLYLASLAACTAITARIYANKKGFDLGQFRVELVLERDEAGALKVIRTLHSDQALTDEQWSRLLNIVDRSPVSRAMKEEGQILSVRGA